MRNRSFVDPAPLAPAIASSARSTSASMSGGDEPSAVRRASRIKAKPTPDFPCRVMPARYDTAIRISLRARPLRNSAMCATLARRDASPLTRCDVATRAANVAGEVGVALTKPSSAKTAGMRHTEALASRSSLPRRGSTKRPAQFDLRPLEHPPLAAAERRSRPVDMEHEHRHRRAEGIALSSSAVLRRALEEARDRRRITPRKNTAIEVARIAGLRHPLRRRRSRRPRCLLRHLRSIAPLGRARISA